MQCHVDKRVSSVSPFRCGLQRLLLFGIRGAACMSKHKTRYYSYCCLYRDHNCHNRRQYYLHYGTCREDASLPKCDKQRGVGKTAP